MENLASIQVIDFVRNNTSPIQISKTLNGTDGINVWRGAGPLAGSYAHEVRAITSGPPPTTGGGGATTRVRYGFFS